MILASQLAYTYGAQRKIEFPQLSFERGTHALLLGESGCGKTTLLHLLGGLLRLQQGRIRILETELGALSESELDRFRGKHFGFIFQRNHLMQSLTVRENLLMSRYLAGESTGEERAREVLDKLGLTEKRDARISALSQGQAQRVAIARAVMNKPEVILADEPTSALDDTNCDRVISLLLSVAAESNATLLVATHDHRLKSKIANQVLL